MSELAEYTFCPRAWWYRGHPPPGVEDPGTRPQVRAGQRFHDRELGADQRRERGATGLTLLAVAAVLVMLLAILWGVGVG